MEIYVQARTKNTLVDDGTEFCRGLCILIVQAQDGRWRAPEEATGTVLGLGSGICERR